MHGAGAAGMLESCLPKAMIPRPPNRFCLSLWDMAWFQSQEAHHTKRQEEGKGWGEGWHGREGYKAALQIPPPPDKKSGYLILQVCEERIA